MRFLGLKNTARTRRLYREMVAILEGHGVSDPKVWRHDESNRRIFETVQFGRKCVPGICSLERYRTGPVLENETFQTPKMTPLLELL